MHGRSRLAPAFALTTLLVAFAGCGSKEGNFATVSGVVSQDGTPMDGAKVTFHSTVEVDGKKTAFAASTDSSGKYLIAAAGKDAGIPPGMYKVTVNKPAVKGGVNLPPDWDAGQSEAAGLLTPGAGAKAHETVGTTKLTATLETGKNQNVDFNIKK